MAWDDTAKKVAIKAIGTVESSMRYDSINYNDPITVGIAQWYGPRAADIIKKMGAKHASEYSGVASSLMSDLNSHGNDSWWTNRWLSRLEGNSLLPLLRAGAAEQDAQLVADLEAYFQAARNVGIDPNGNTDTFIYFCVMYHQGPRYAIRVMNRCGGGASLAAVHHACLNDGVLGKYPNRYNQAYEIIKNHDTSGVSTPGTPAPQNPGNGGSGGATNGGTNAGSVTEITRDGSGQLYLRTSSGLVTAQPTNNHNRWVLPQNSISNGGSAATPDNGGSGGEGGTPPPPGGGGTTAQLVFKWMYDRQMKFAYRQAPGRLNPDQSGFGDCSSTIWRAYKDVAGINVGTWTGDQYNRGREVVRGSGMPSAAQIALMQVADMIVMSWGDPYPNTDHVEMYTGDGVHTIGHGGPGNGPHINPLAMLRKASWWTVRRHL